MTTDLAASEQPDITLADSSQAAEALAHILARMEPRIQTEPNSGCWLWMGAATKAGYGLIQTGRRSAAGNRQPEYVHRIMFAAVRGPIPSGFTIDHLCRMPPCVNPGHLDAVTMAENIRRSDGMSARHARSTQCKRGHQKTEENTYRYPGGWTECRPCRQHRMRVFAAKRSAS